MLSKNPLDLLRDKKFSSVEIAEALRLAIMAELDAVSLYTQLARMIEDNRYKAVFEDIAREEKTHVGEFLALLKSLDPEQVEELKKGAREVEELTGIKVESSDANPGKINDKSEDNGNNATLKPSNVEVIREAFYGFLEKTRTVRKHIPVVHIGEGIEAIIMASYRSREYRKPALSITTLSELSIEFSIPDRVFKYSSRQRDLIYRDLVAAPASAFGIAEDKYILFGDEEVGTTGILNTEGIVEYTARTWDQLGEALEDVYKAVEILVKNNVARPYLLLLNPATYVKLLRVYDRAGATELERVKHLADKVVVTPHVPRDKAVLLASSPNYIDLVVGVDVHVDYVDLESGEHLYRVWETLALRIKNPSAIVVMKFA